MRAIIAFLFLIFGIAVAQAQNTTFYDKQADTYWRVIGIARGSEQATCFIESSMTDGSYVQIHRALTDGEVWVVVHNVLWNIDPRQTGKLRWNVFIGGKSVHSDFDYSADGANSILILKILEKGFFDALRDSDKFTIEMPDNIKSISFGFKNKGAPVFGILADCVSRNEATYRKTSSQTSSPANTPPASAGGSMENRLNPAEKRLIQEGLVLYGDYNGLTDGVFGNTTRQAIAKFQAGQKRPATGELTSTDVLELATMALKIKKTIGWQPLGNSHTGITMFYPAAILTKRADSDMGGETLDSQDGSLSLQTMRIPNAAPNGINILFQRLRQRNNSEVTYQSIQSNYFVITGKMQGYRFYSRAEQRGDEIRGYDYLWKNDKDAQLSETISLLMSGSFYPFGGDPVASQESNGYPTINAIANAASGSAPAPSNDNAGRGNTDTPNTNTTTNTRGQPDRIGGSGKMKDITEQLEGALPPPGNGALTTSDGRGLRFSYHYTVPEDKILALYYQWAADTHLLMTLPEINVLDGLFVIPRPLHYVTAQCGAVNAFYTKKNGAIVLCYELIHDLFNMGEALSKGMSNPRAFQTEFVRDNIRFILLHETGHALIDMLDLPAVGREEDSVDQLATILLLMMKGIPGEQENDKARILQLASTWFKVNSSQQSLDVSTFADEHSLDAQRYYNILCIAYGLNTQEYAPLVSKGLLPETRARGCVSEATKIKRSWLRLIGEHFSPHANALADKEEKRRRDSQSKNPLEWDRQSNPFAD